MADLDALRKQFVVSGVSFGMKNELAFVRVETLHAKATIYLQGAHLTDWQPAGFEPAIFVSRTSDYLAGKPIRGGIPVVFPWFAGDKKKDRVNGHPGPSHGFVRTQEWTLDTVQLEHHDMRLMFVLGPTAISQSMAFDSFLLAVEFAIGKTLSFTLTVKNLGAQSLKFEEAFHSYYRVVDIHEVSVTGLETTHFIDKTDSMKVKQGEVIRFAGVVDRVYNDVTTPATVEDVAGKRSIRVEKHGSDSTIVWNPAAPLADLGEWDWHEMVAVETGNVGTNTVELAAGETKVMGSTVRVERLV